MSVSKLTDDERLNNHRNNLKRSQKSGLFHSPKVLEGLSNTHESKYHEVYGSLSALI